LLVSDLVDCGAVRFGTFILTSGKKSDYYVDIKKATSDPSILEEITRRFVEHHIRADRVAGVELGAVPLIVAYSMETRIPFIIIRKGDRSHGTERRFEGEILPGEKILLIEDVVTSGSSVITAMNTIEESGGIIVAVLAVVDREEGGSERISDRVEFHTLLRASDLLAGSRT
jgi:orotate phosphoribosyltransferase